MVCCFCDVLVPFNSLEDIDLSYNRIGNRGAAALAECIANKKLWPKSLSLSSNNIGDDGIVAIVKCLAKDGLSLRSLDISHNSFSRTGTKAIVSALARPSLPLEVIKSEGLNTLGDTECESLGNALKTNTNLKKLWVGARLPRVTAKGTRALLDGVKENSTLEEADMSGSGLTVLQVDELKYYLELNKGARRLLQVQPPLPQALWPRVLKKADRCAFNKCNFRQERAPDVLYYFVKEKCDLFARPARSGWKGARGVE